MKLDRTDKQGVVGQRAEKLRRHDGVKTALHRMAGESISWADALVKVRNRSEGQAVISRG